MVRTIKSSRRRAGIGMTTVALSALVLGACGGTTTTPSGSSTPAGPSKVATIASEVPADIQGTAVQIATDATYAPNEFINPDTGQIQGWDIDLGLAICKVMGLVCTFNNVTFDDIIAQLKASTPAEQAGGDKPRYQFSMASFTPTTAREMSGIDFISYYQAGEAYVFKSGATPVTMASDMCGHKVAVESGTVEELDAWGFQGKMVGGTAIAGDTNHCPAGMDITVDSYGTQTQADAALQSGRDDVGFLDTPVANYEVKVANGKLQAGGQPCRVAAYGLAIVKGSGLEQAITDALKYLIDHNFYTQILTTWNVQAGAIPSSQIVLNNNNVTGMPCVPSY